MRTPRTLAILGLALAWALAAVPSWAEPAATPDPSPSRKAPSVDWKSDFPSDAVERRVTRRLSLDERSVSVKGTLSRVIVEGGDGDAVGIRADLRFWAADEDWMERVRDAFDLKIEERSREIQIGVEMPDPTGPKSKRKKVLYEIQLHVTVPRGTEVAVDNEYGSVTALDTAGAVRVSSQSGNVRVQGSADETDVDARYGSVDLTDVQGATRVRTASGNIRARGVKGALRVDAKYGSIEVSDVEGELTANASSGNVKASELGAKAKIDSAYGNVQVATVEGELEVSTTSGAIEVADVASSARLSSSYGAVVANDVRSDLEIRVASGNATARTVEGRLVVESSYGNVVVEDVGGNGEIVASNGGVTVNDLRGALTVETSFGTVRVRDVGGDLVVSASNTGVQATDVAGQVDIETSYAGVRVENPGSAVRIRNANGQVTVQGLRNQALTANHSVETSYADITFSWPRARGLSYELEASYGRIRNPFVGSVQESGSRRAMTGTHGDGAAELRLSASNGDVTLREE